MADYSHNARVTRLPARTGKTVCVTGGAGFLGSHLCERLIAQGHQVYCIDNFQTGSMSNIAHLLLLSGFCVIEHDIVEPLSARLPRFDEIYNLACPASPRHYQADPVATAKTCSIGVLRLLERAKTDNARFFQASTSEVYGDPDVHPQRENYAGNVNCVGPRSCYDEGKRFAETLITDFGHQAGLDVRIARIFNTYGPRMQADDGRVVSNFIVQALAGDSITIYGDGSQTRSFCYVDDLISGFIKLMALEATARHRAAHLPVNLGNPAEMTVGALAQKVLQKTGSHSALVKRPMPVDDPRRRKPDITRAEQLLGWRPTVDIDVGLDRTIEWFAGQLNLHAAAVPAPSMQGPHHRTPALHGRPTFV
ncbi:MAG: SDR family oxidoreductase [Phyllobacteriaceae bacterium]|nr:SDR family oxidoreductase [Phyllobacteriaceae bacterium]